MPPRLHICKTRPVNPAVHLPRPFLSMGCCRDIGWFFTHIDDSGDGLFAFFFDFHQKTQPWSGLRRYAFYLSSLVQCGQRVASSWISVLQNGHRRGAFAGAGAGSGFFIFIIALTTRNMQKAISTKSTMF